jgi:hypothetical protein
MPTALAIAAAIAAPGAYTPPADAPADCRVIHYLADGRRIETPPRVRARRDRTSSTRSFSKGEDGTAQSSAWASAGGSGAATSSAYSESAGRSLRITRDQSGCLAEIDERAAGARR